MMPRNPSTSGKDAISTSDIKELVKDVCTSKVFIDSLVETLTQAIASKYEEQIKSLQTKLINVETELQLQVKECSALNKKCEELDKKCDELEQYSRRNCLRFFGIPESDKENTNLTVLQIIKAKLNINLSAADIDRSHRIGVNKSKPRAIIVKFVSYQDRNAIFKAKSLLKGSGITIKEDLTKTRHHLLQYASKKFDFKNVWTVDGQLFVKVSNKVYRVYSVRDADLIKIN